MFKSQLQEYAQKAGLAAPVYDGVKEGPSHQPQFRASVTIHGKVYESPRLFNSLKKAEHAAAEVALADFGNSEKGPLHESGLCKNLLQEYTQKTKLPLPVYKVMKMGELHTLTFSAIVEVAGVQYNGGECKTKKEAEIRAARTALVAIYSGSGGHPLGVVEDKATEELPSGVGQATLVPRLELEPEEATLEPKPGEVTSEPMSKGKRKKKFKFGIKKRNQTNDQTEIAEDLKTVETSLGTLDGFTPERDATSAGALPSWIPEQGKTAESCTIANSKATPCASGSAQEQEV